MCLKRFGLGKPPPRLGGSGPVCGMRLGFRYSHAHWVYGRTSPRVKNVYVSSNISILVATVVMIAY